MNATTIMKVAGLVCSVAGTVISGIASDKEKKALIAKEVAKNLSKKH